MFELRESDLELVSGGAVQITAGTLTNVTLAFGSLASSFASGGTSSSFAAGTPNGNFSLGIGSIAGPTTLLVV
jgi:hypothetical protein